MEEITHSFCKQFLHSLSQKNNPQKVQPSNFYVILLSRVENPMKIILMGCFLHTAGPERALSGTSCNLAEVCANLLVAENFTGVCIRLWFTLSKPI